MRARGIVTAFTADVVPIHAPLSSTPETVEQTASATSAAKTRSLNGYPMMIKAGLESSAFPLIGHDKQ